MKLAVIIDSSDAFVDFQKELVLEEWGAEETQKVDSIQSVGNATLFGAAPTAILKLQDPAHVKKVLKELQTLIENDELESKCSEGLIITSSLNKNSTRTLLKVLQPYVTPKFGGKNLTETLVKEYMNLNREAEEFLLNYLGQDYDAAIPLARSIGKLPIEQQRKISVESLYYRLPNDPGGVPPWEIEGPLWAGDFSKTIELHRRIVNNSSPLLPLFILNKKVRLIFRCAALLEVNPRMTVSAISKALGVPDNYPLKLAVGKAKELGVKKAERIAEIFSETERKLKGGGSGPQDAVMELALLQAVQTVRSQRS